LRPRRRSWRRNEGSRALRLLRGRREPRRLRIGVRFPSVWVKFSLEA
jgi:hypothetical protein